MLRLTLRRAAAQRPRAPPAQRVLASRCMCNAATKGPQKIQNAPSEPEPEPERRGMLHRLLGSTADRNPFLVAMGYYSRESVALGAGTELYTQLRARAEDALRALPPPEDGAERHTFAARFELLSVHVYLSLHRLRQEKGSEAEGDCKTCMQCVFDVFWTDVRNRMLIGEEGMTLIPSGRWVKECEQMFFGMALAFDEAWGDRPKMLAAVQRNVTSMRENAPAFVDYLESERRRLDAIPIEHILKQKRTWSPTFPGFKRF